MAQSPTRPDSGTDRHLKMTFLPADCEDHYVTTENLSKRNRRRGMDRRGDEIVIKALRNSPLIFNQFFHEEEVPTCQEVV